jgi:RecB family endonuclease NucS
MKVYSATKSHCFCSRTEVANLRGLLAEQDIEAQQVVSLYVQIHRVRSDQRVLSCEHAASDYLILIKQDGSLQVHACKGVKPRNWQACTDEITLARERVS